MSLGISSGMSLRSGPAVLVLVEVAAPEAAEADDPVGLFDTEVE